MADIEGAISRIVEHAADYRRGVEEYLNPDSRYAAYSFDSLEPNDSYRLGIEDCFSLNFLDAPLRVHAFRHAQRDQEKIADCLRRIDPQLCLWQLTGEDDETYKAASSLYWLVRKWPYVGPTRASKLLARKRPHLIPILDSRVGDFYGIKDERDDYWIPLGGVLQNEEIREEIEELRPPGLPTSALSLLRILDIAIWMHDPTVEAPGASSWESDEAPALNHVNNDSFDAGGESN